MESFIFYAKYTFFRGSYPWVFCQKTVPKKFSNFVRKVLPTTLLKRTSSQVFSCKLNWLETSFLNFFFLKRVFCKLAHQNSLNSTGQKQPPRGVLRNRSSKNMQQIYRIPMMKCNFNINVMFSCKFAVYVLNTFS